MSYRRPYLSTLETLAFDSDVAVEVAAPLVLHALSKLGDRGGAQIDKLLQRDPQPVELLVHICLELTPKSEREVAEHAATPPEVLERLATSRRIRTLRALSKRRDLPEAAAVRLAKHRDPKIAAGGRSNPSWPTAERLALLDSEEGLTRRDIITFSRADRAFLEVVLDRDVSSADLLELLPGGELEERYVDRLEAHLRTGDVDRYALKNYANRKPSGRALDAVLTYAAEHDSSRADILGAVLGAKTVTDSSWSGYLRGINRWDEASSLQAALGSGDAALRAAALASALLDPQDRRDAVTGVDVRDQRCVASNPTLTHDEVEHLLATLDPDQQWRLLHAELTADQRSRLIASSPVVAERLVRRARSEMSASTPLPAGLSEWLDIDLLSIPLVERDRLLPGRNDFGVYVDTFGQHLPSLYDVAATWTRLSDQLTPGHAKAVAGRFSAHITTAAAAEIVVGLLSEWEASFDELLVAAAQLGENQDAP